MSFALVSPYMTFSCVYITDYTLLLYSHYAALWASEQHNGSYVLPGTSWYTEAHTQIHSDTVNDSLSHDLSSTLFISPLICLLFRYLIWTPLAPVWHRQRPTHWFNPALFCNNLLPNFFLFPVWDLSAVIQLHISLGLAVLLPAPVSVLQFSSTSSWFGLCVSSQASYLAPDLQANQQSFNPPPPSVLKPQHRGSTLSIPSPNHTTQSKLASRFLGLAQWVWVCVTPLP